MKKYGGHSMKVNYSRCVAVLIVLSVLFAPFIDAAELSLFERLKLKTQEKVQQFQDKNWLMTKGTGTAVGFVTGKIVGALGAGIGGLLGLCIGGPVVGAAGAYIGYRICDVIGKTYGKAIGEDMARDKLNKEKVSFKDSFKSLDKKVLAASSVGAVAGDFIGEILGVSAGLALMAGVGPIALPIIGIITGAVIGKTIGRAIGRWAGKSISRRAAVWGYKATIGAMKDEGQKQASPVIATPVAANAQAVQDRYEAAYKAYIACSSSPQISANERERIFAEYQSALTDLKSLK
jgi:hypothetical protein